MRRERNVFLLGVVVLAMLVTGGCTRNLLGPEPDPEPEPTDTDTTVVDTVDHYGFLAVIASEPDGPQVDSVRVYLKQGDPPELTAWPNSTANYTPVNPNRMEPGTYMVVGEKDGYSRASTTVTVSDDTVNTVIAYLTMHRFSPSDDGEEPPEPEPENPLTVEFINGKIRLSGEGHEYWTGAECYNPVTEPVNWWSHGEDRGNYTEIPIRNGYSHIVLWASAVTGYQNQGGHGVGSRLPDHSKLVIGQGVFSAVPGYVTINNP